MNITNMLPILLSLEFSVTQTNGNFTKVYLLPFYYREEVLRILAFIGQNLLSSTSFQVPLQSSLLLLAIHPNTGKFQVYRYIYIRFQLQGQIKFHPHTSQGQQTSGQTRSGVQCLSTYSLQRESILSSQVHEGRDFFCLAQHLSKCWPADAFTAC